MIQGLFQKTFIKVQQYILLQKKSGVDQCSNFINLILIPHASKLLPIVISKRIGNRVEDQLNQNRNFRKNKSTREAILNLRV